MIDLLLYTPAQQRDVLGHLIVRVEHGTISHTAVAFDGLFVVEAVWPRVHMLEGNLAQLAIQGAAIREPIQVHDAWCDARARQRSQAWINHPYGWQECLGDGIACTFGLRNVVPQLPGAINCSHMGGDILQVAGDPRVPIDVLTSGLTPADLAEMVIGRRVVRP